MASCLITSVTGCQFTLNAYIADGVPFTNDTVIYDTICEGEPYAKNYFDLPPQYTIGTSTHINSFYDKTTCSGTITVLLNLTVIQRYYHIEEAICYGEDYIENGFAILKPAVGVVHDTLFLSNSQGCDIFHILHLTISPTNLSFPKTILGNASPCSGELEIYTLPYAEFFTGFNWTVPDHVNTVSGLNTAKITLQFTEEAVADTLELYAKNGCDSVFLTLSVKPKPSYYLSFTDSTCTGAAYHENDFDIPRQDSSGFYVFSRNLTTEDGCDSVRTLYLDVFPSPKVEIQTSKDVICEDDSIELHVISTSADFKVKKTKIGDILCTDESIVTKEDYPTSGKTAMGIVFWVSPDKTHGWVVDLTVIDSAAWATITGTIPGIDTLPYQTFAQFTWIDTAGYQNTKAIRAAGNASQFPAAWAVDFDNGWFLPALTQAKILMFGIKLIEPSFSVVGVPLVSIPSTWTSTPMSNNSALYGSRGDLLSRNRSDKFPIRQIRYFTIVKSQ